jgi:DinB family protein
VICPSPICGDRSALRASGPWARLRQEHLAAVGRFVTLASSIPPSRWPLPSEPDKWSPAQVAEHVVLTYEALLAELAGGPAMRIRTRWWIRIPLRLVLLPRIFRTGRIPAGARAPRELRPGSEALDQAALLERLQADARRLEARLADHAGPEYVTHPFFGRLSMTEVLRFCAIHTTHHADQLPRAESEKASGS